MYLPEALTKVTKLSKALFLVSFITLPFVGFLLGMRYQELLSPQDVPIYATPTTLPTAFIPSPTITPTSAASVDEIKSMYRISAIEKRNEVYFFSVQEIDWLREPRCTSYPARATTQIPACNPNGYLIRDRGPEIILTASTSNSAQYRGQMSDTDGFVDEEGTMSLDEFYKNFLGERGALNQKKIFIPGKSGLYTIRSKGGVILDLSGIYTP